MLGGCQGSTGPASIGPDGYEWASRFPYLTIRDQVAAQVRLADALGIDVWAAVLGGSMGGMHALEWAAGLPDRVERVGILSAPPVNTADQIALNSVQLEAIRIDPRFQSGEYYDAGDGDGPNRGLALARRMALLNYRSPTELNQRFQRSWQSGVSPLGHGGRFAVESYLDFHGNRFTRRFDANSYITLVDAMNSHDVGRDRGGVEDALARVTATTLVLGIDSDRLFPIDGQHRIARGIRIDPRRRPRGRAHERLRPRRLPHRDPRGRRAHAAPARGTGTLSRSVPARVDPGSRADLEPVAGSGCRIRPIAVVLGVLAPVEDRAGRSAAHLRLEGLRVRPSRAAASALSTSGASLSPCRVTHVGGYSVSSPRAWRCSASAGRSHSAVTASSGWSRSSPSRRRDEEEPGADPQRQPRGRIPARQRDQIGCRDLEPRLLPRLAHRRAPGVGLLRPRSRRRSGHDRPVRACRPGTPTRRRTSRDRGARS